MPLPFALESISQIINGETSLGLALLGSHAVGAATPYSDVDLLQLVHPEYHSQSSTLLIDGHLTNISRHHLDEIESWFGDPEEVVNRVAGLRALEVLDDPGGHLAALQAKARDFRWTQELREMARRQAITRLVGWTEEASKGLAGLSSDHRGRLLNASFGLSWGLNSTIQLARGVLLQSDNDIYDEVGRAMLVEPDWLRLRAAAFGLGDHTSSFEERVVAGLGLFVKTARLLGIAEDGAPVPISIATENEQESQRQIIQTCCKRIDRFFSEGNRS